jgi:hypothetical protein
VAPAGLLIIVVCGSSVASSQAIEKLVALLDTLDRWIDETPPVDQPSRFGNKAYRTWYAKLDQVRLTVKARAGLGWAGLGWAGPVGRLLWSQMGPVLKAGHLASKHKSKKFVRMVVLFTWITKSPSSGQSPGKGRCGYPVSCARLLIKLLY